MTGMIRNPHAKMLCDLAQEDETALKFPVSDSIFGFHAQQSCEKLLKALISSLKLAYPLTHSLEKLADLLIGSNEPFPTLPTIYSISNPSQWNIATAWEGFLQKLTKS
jgi:hypothetical protein